MQTTPHKFMIIGLFLIVATLSISPSSSFAHCDTLNGPVVKAADSALEQRDITPLLKWVRAEDEDAIRQAFQKTLAVRSNGPEAKELADQYFFETLVRIHRAGEGMPFTGLKPGAAVDPAVAMADQALASGKVDALVDALNKTVSDGLRSRFSRVLATTRHADDSVAAGREYVEAYVAFTHYAEGLYGMAQSGPGHHPGGEDKQQRVHHGEDGEDHH